MEMLRIKAIGWLYSCLQIEHFSPNTSRLLGEGSVTLVSAEPSRDKSVCLCLAVIRLALLFESELCDSGSLHSVLTVLGLG